MEIDPDTTYKKDFFDNYFVIVVTFFDASSPNSYVKELKYNENDYSIYFVTNRHEITLTSYYVVFYAYFYQVKRDVSKPVYAVSSNSERNYFPINELSLKEFLPLKAIKI